MNFKVNDVVIVHKPKSSSSNPDEGFYYGYFKDEVGKVIHIRPGNDIIINFRRTSFNCFVLKEEIILKKVYDTPLFKAIYGLTNED